MRAKGQTSLHLLLASIVTMFGVMLILITLALSWELWMVPIILVGNTLVWCLHIGRAGSETFYQNLCSGLLMIGFFFFGVHKATLFDIPSVAGMIILVFSMLDKKRLLYMTAVLYVLELIYHFFVLHSITYNIGLQDVVRLAMGATLIAGSMAIAIFRINRRRGARKRYDKTLAQLEITGRQNAEFLSNVSHELRTPINMVLGISEVILEKNISREIRTDIHSIQMAGKRLSNQINNMIDYTEIVEGTLTAENEPYRINSLLNDIITMTAMQNSKHQLEMVFDLDPKMPSVLIGDVEKISHILKILLENSIKFTEEGGINVCIQYRKENYGINMIIDINDTGIGMTGSQLTQMCDDFYQADSGSSRFAGGLGLGLPIARGLLHAMGGFIHFDSKEQEGLHAQITIPQGVADETPAMIISRPDKLCIACYFRPDKYVSDDVRIYYDNMILHMMKGLHVEGYQAHNFEGLQKLLANHAFTHVFITQAEYQENISYYENLAEKLQVVVIAEREFMLNRNSRLMVIHKPFFALAVVNLLNGQVEANGFDEAQAAGRKPFSCEGVRVLAVDDEEMNLVVAKGVLGSYGIQVDTCLSGKEAVDRCAATPYDIIFLDHMMPGFDGVETLKQIRKINDGAFKELPIIALTANTISGAREMFRNEGFTEFIPKPIERAVLERVLRKVLPLHQIQYDEAPIMFEGFTKETIASAASPGGKKKKKKRKKNAGSADIPLMEEAVSKKKSSGKSRQEKTPENLVPDRKYQEEASDDFLFKEDFYPEDKDPAQILSGIKEPDKLLPEDKIDSEGRIDFEDKVDSKDEVSDEMLSEYKDEPMEEAFEEFSEEDDREYDSFSEDGSQEDYAIENESLLPYDELTQIGINVQLGLDYCCGEEEFYLEMLRMFCSQAVEKKAEIISLFDTENWGDYAVKVHALKSTSLTIGAERLAEQAKLLELASKERNIGYVRHSHPTLLRLYDETCNTLAGL
jgi:signal transduction histidine kinase/DNA-binding response OmpR family regulator/HPt (histidine-containing phosphotransfer) domain-containing protein